MTVARVYTSNGESQNLGGEGICNSYSTGPGVNEPSPRAKPEDRVCLHCQKEP